MPGVAVHYREVPGGWVGSHKDKVCSFNNDLLIMQKTPDKGVEQMVVCFCSSGVSCYESVRKECWDNWGTEGRGYKLRLIK